MASALRKLLRQEASVPALLLGAKKALTLVTHKLFIVLYST